MHSGWVDELWRFVGLSVLALLFGVLIGQVQPVLILVLVGYVLRNLFNMQRLANWVSDPRGDGVPISFGMWGDIYARILRNSERQALRERRLVERLANFQDSAAALPDAVVALGTEGEIRWFNDAASRLLRLQPAKDIGQPLVNLFRNPELVRFLVECDFDRTLETNAPGDYSRQLALRLTPYGEGQLLVLAQDITERIRVERVRRDFVANVSHELRTPLTVIIGFLENLADGQGVPEVWARPLELMTQQAARMKQIVEDLLLLARVESAEEVEAGHPVDVAQMANMIVAETRSLRPDVPRIEFVAESSRGLFGDGKQLRSAFGNLVVNAVNYTPAKGAVKVRWYERGDQVCFEVADTGEGIAAEHIPRLTERFYRVDAGRSRQRGGTGLGLAIVKHVLQSHGAHLEIESVPGRGSLFRCVFPASRVADRVDKVAD